MTRMLLIASVLAAAFAARAETVLIENVRIFNGVDPKLTAGHVLVVDGLIDTIASKRT